MPCRASAAPATITNDQQTENCVCSTYFYCDVGQQEPADEIIEQLDKPIFDARVGDGTLNTWGWLAHVGGGEYRRPATMTAKDTSTLMAARGAVVAAFQADPRFLVGRAPDRQSAISRSMCVTALAASAARS